MSEIRTTPEALIFGHANMDLDCLGSLALAGTLFPDHQPVRSRLAHPAVKEALMVYQYKLPLLSLKEIKGAAPSRLIVVDTRSKSRIREFLDALGDVPETITIYDHHRNEEADIPGARLVEGLHGAESSSLALMCRDKGVAVSPEIATIALVGIYADTGNFTHKNTTPGDFLAVSWLMEQGASLKIVRRFLRPLREPSQADLFHHILGNLTWRRFHGHVVALSRVELAEQTSGVAEVVDRVFADEPVDVLIVLVDILDRGHNLVIGRSRKDRFNLLDVLAPFGGHGHMAAASALIKDHRENIWTELLQCLETVPVDALTAIDLMSRDVMTITPDTAILDASILFEQSGFSGAPVIGVDGDLVGMFALKDVSKARKAGAMKAPISAYMSRRIISCSPGDTIREVERHMLGHNVGHLPVMEGTRLVGLITRGDYKKFYS
ncbi:MAG: CBS domain-containing protein [Spirochaetaceae bacterium]|nr:CBS domain-containing protein [Spirochaetaceae bacterium]